LCYRVVLDRAVAQPKPAAIPRRIPDDCVVLGPSAAAANATAAREVAGRRIIPDCVVLDGVASIQTLERALDSAACVAPAVLNREALKNAGGVLGRRESHHRAVTLRFDNSAAHGGGVEGIGAVEDDVFAAEVDVLDIGALGNDYGIAIGCGVNPVLDALERGAPARTIARLRNRVINIPFTCSQV
jgi:hypothetical protein